MEHEKLDRVEDAMRDTFRTGARAIGAEAEQLRERAVMVYERMSEWAREARRINSG